MQSKSNHPAIKTLTKMIAKLIEISVILLCFMIMTAYIYEHTDNDIKTQSTIGVTSIGNNFYTDASCDDELLDNVQTFLAALPEDIQNQFQDDEWQIILSAQPPSVLVVASTIIKNDSYDTSAFDTIGGLTVPKAKTIYVNTSKMTTGDSYESFVHEFGHYLDYVHGFPSMSRRFKALYDSNKSNAHYNMYESSTASEFFAATYMQYYISPDTLRENAPAMYNYICEIINTPAPRYHLVRRLISDDAGMLRQLVMNVETMLNIS